MADKITCRGRFARQYRCAKKVLKLDIKNKNRKTLTQPLFLKQL